MSNYNIYYNGAFDTVLSNYTLSVTGPGQVVVTSPEANDQLVGITSPNVANQQGAQFMFVYDKKQNENSIDLKNFKWIETNKTQISFIGADQLLTSNADGSFNYIDPPTFKGYLVYNNETGIQWEATTIDLPFEAGKLSQIIAYESFTGKAVSIAAPLNNFVLYSSITTPTGLAWGYVTPLMLGVPVNQIQDNLFLKIGKNNTFTIAEIPEFNMDNIVDGAIVYYYTDNTDTKFMTGISPPTRTNQILYSVYSNNMVSYAWGYITTDHFGIQPSSLNSNHSILITNNSKQIEAVPADTLFNTPFCNLFMNFSTPVSFTSSIDIYSLSLNTTNKGISEYNTFKPENIVQFNYFINMCLLSNFTNAVFSYDPSICIGIQLQVRIEYSDDSTILLNPVIRQNFTGAGFTFSLSGGLTVTLPSTTKGISRLNVILTPVNFNGTGVGFINFQNFYFKNQYIDEI